MNKLILSELGLSKLVDWGLIGNSKLKHAQPVTSVNPSKPAPPVATRKTQPVIPKQPTSIQLHELANEVSNCQLCGLYAGRTNTVFGTEPIDTGGILLVGEAPNEQEDKQGDPFVGQAGQLLDNMLQSIGYGRGNGVYITNIVKCRPPADRDPSVAEISSCHQFLTRQIELLAPRLIVAVGKVAGNALLNKEKAQLKQLRGTMHSFNDIPLLVIYHPTYYLHSPSAKLAGWQDMLRIRDEHNKLLSGVAKT